MMMKRRFRLGLALAGALAVLSCGSDDKTGATNPPEGTPASKAIGFKFSTGKFEIQPGDTFECFYTDTITEKQLNVRSATGTQGPGGHHITVYYSDQKIAPTHHPCNDIEMVGFHQIAGATDGKEGQEGIIGLPDGYATKVPAGKQLIVQAHYIRTENTPLTVEDVVTLETLEDKDVKAFANAFVLNDGAFKLAPRSNAVAAAECVVPRDFDILLLLGHMHEWGASYKLEKVDEKGKALETLYQTTWDPVYTSRPPVTKYAPEKPLHLTKGTRIRQTCTWKNTEDKEMAFPREMCVMFSYYFPDDGFIVCDSNEVKL